MDINAGPLAASLRPGEGRRGTGEDARSARTGAPRCALVISHPVVSLLWVNVCMCVRERGKERERERETNLGKSPVFSLSNVSPLPVLAVS